MSHMLLGFALFFGLWQADNEALLKQLGSNSYQVRVKAHFQLMKKGESPLYPLLVPSLQKATASDDLEIALRAKLLLEEIQTREKQVWLTKLEKCQLPWIDMLPKDHPCNGAIIGHFLHTAQKQIGRCGPPHWQDYRLATQLYIRDLLMETSIAQVRKLLYQMAEEEQAWVTRNSRNYTPPLQVYKYHFPP